MHALQCRLLRPYNALPGDVNPLRDNPASCQRATHEPTADCDHSSEVILPLGAAASQTYSELTTQYKGELVIQKNLVYRKSAKGAEAIATRQHGLAPRQRSMLIMVDGKRSVDQLSLVAQVLGAPDQLLGQLLQEGFIEPMPGTPSTATPPADVAVLPSPARAAMTLDEARRFASRRLTALLGPNADEMCLRIEGARSVQDYRVAIRSAEGMLRHFVSASTAKQFAADIHERMPAG